MEIFVAFLENLKFTYFFILDWWFLDLNKEEEVIELIFYKGLLDTIYNGTDYLNLLLWIDFACWLTPPRTRGINGVKSQIFKPKFLA